MFFIFGRLEKQKKILSIQYLRGLAALGVVCCHYGSYLTLYPKLSALFSFGQTGVYVFFLISGFIIVYSLKKSNYEIKEFFRFLLKRSIRIDPAYISVILLTIIFFASVSLSKNEGVAFNLGQFCAHIFYVVPFTKYQFYNQVFWTLGVEFQFYLLIGLVYFLFKNRIYQTCFLIGFSLTCFIPLSNSYYLLTSYAPVFALGISLIPIFHKWSWQDIGLPTIILILIGFKFSWPILVLLSAASFAVLFIKGLFKPLIFLGEISYSLYLTHGLIFILFVGIGKKMHFNFESNQIMWLFVEMVLAIFFAYLFYWLIERPSIKLSKRIFYRKQSTKPVVA